MFVVFVEMLNCETVRGGTGKGNAYLGNATLFVLATKVVVCIAEVVNVSRPQHLDLEGTQVFYICPAVPGTGAARGNGTGLNSRE